ncbi:ABC transporter [Paenibacillus albidus]|uniref:ABC transporter n=1 Tax=Paenibacillus albidus TaxID=2041023 RepID=A0A917FSA7_9BACL|nr:ABC transporter ATP-binding protein [Paenibacillus albidus]GGF99230.1 ABC transporter [Paenibacillus albidus]
MFKPKEYKTLDYLILPLRIIPAQTIYAILITILNSLIPAYQTLVIANFINTAMDIFNGKTDYSSIYLPIVLIMCFVMFTNLVPSITQIIDTSGQNKLNAILKKEISLKHARLEYKHIENHDTQEILNRVCSDPLGNFMAGLNNLFRGATLLISSFSLLMIVMSSTFISGLIIIFISVPLFYIAMKTGKKNYEMEVESQKIQRKYNYLSSILTNRDSAEERKLFSYSTPISEKFAKLYNESSKIETKIEIKSYINMKSGSMVTLLIVIIIVALLLPSLHSGGISLGVFIALVNAIYGLVQNMSWQLSSTMYEYARLKEYLNDFSIFIKLSEKKDACVLPADVDSFVFKSLEFRKVSFKYPGTERYILKDCSFVLNHNTNYCFVGVNGAGKTTITKLLVGMYDEFEGEILINGKNIRDYTFAEIKGLISVVYQDFAKYSLKFKDNILIGNIIKTDEEKLVNIVSEMGLDDVVKSLEFGMDTYLGKVKENSKDISGGQWQRLAISRLLYSNSKINILDEPTAALDPLAESNVYELFRQVNKDRFSIYITHRLGAAKIADEILVVNEGYIAEQGSHEQLMSLENGIYSKMFASQKSWYETDI